MTKVTFTPEEITAIKGIQDKYNVLGIQLVQLKLSKRNTTNYLKSLEEQEALLEEQIVSTNTEEKDLAKVLDTRYGPGILDLESGEFTSKTQP